MQLIGSGQWESLEARSWAAFSVAGVLLVIFAVLLGYEALTEGATPEDLFGPAGFFFAMIGLLGVSCSIFNASRRLSRIIAGGAGLGATGWFVITLFAIAEAAGIIPPLEQLGATGNTLVVGTGIAMMVAYIVAGVGSIRSNSLSMRLGLLLLTPPGIFGVMLVQAVLFTQFGLFTASSMAWSAVALSGAQALAHLGIGYRLRKDIGATIQTTSPLQAVAE